MPKGIWPRPSPEERFWSKVNKTETCWLWTAGLSDGYGVFWIDRRTRLAHRFAYEILIEPIPEGLQLDHLCRIRHCVNPKHLEPVTNRINQLRGYGASGRASRQTHCVNGHPFDLLNTQVDYRGSRRCRTCRSASNRRYNAKRPPRKTQ